MHVVIAQLTHFQEQGCHFSEDDLFGDNDREFPDGVEEHTGDAYWDDVQQIRDWFKPALIGTGEEEINGKKVPWIEFDTTRLSALFANYWTAFQDARQRLMTASVGDFETGSLFLERALDGLKQAYAFDWLWVFDSSTTCRPVSDWLRCLQGHGQPKIQRAYIHATYDGDQ